MSVAEIPEDCISNVSDQTTFHDCLSYLPPAWKSAKIQSPHHRSVFVFGTFFSARKLFNQSKREIGFEMRVASRSRVANNGATVISICVTDSFITNQIQVD